MTQPSRIAAEDYLEALAANGIEHLFVNPGTDFAPIVEAFSRAARRNAGAAADGRAARKRRRRHGARLHYGDRQAAGGDAAHQCWPANAINMLINASREQCRCC